MVFDAVTRKNIDLHAIIRNKKMSAPLHDFVIGIVKQVVYIKFKLTGFIIIVSKESLFQINWSFDINAVVTEV